MADDDAAELAGQVAQLRRDLADLHRLVAAHDDVLLAAAGRLAGDLPHPADPRSGGQAAEQAVRPYVWAGLDRDAAESLWNQLAGFVEWLNRRYQLSTLRGVPACWYRHGDVVEELTALYAAWRAAYLSDAVDTSAPADWHRSYLAPALSRLHTDSSAAKCNPGDHRPEVPAQLSAGDDLLGWIRADLAERDTSEAATADGSTAMQ